MKEKRNPAGKGPILYNVLRIIVVLGWLAFFFYNLYLVRLLGNNYIDDPSDFILFESEAQREAYRKQMSYTPGYNSDWIDEAALVQQCKPMIYFKDFYFKRIDPMVRLLLVLIVLTIAIRIPYEDWKRAAEKIEKLGERFKDE